MTPREVTDMLDLSVGFLPEYITRYQELQVRVAYSCQNGIRIFFFHSFAFLGYSIEKEERPKENEK